MRVIAAQYHGRGIDMGLMIRGLMNGSNWQG